MLLSNASQARLVTSVGVVRRSSWNQSKAQLIEVAVPSPLAGHAAVGPCRFVGGIHAANGPASGERGVSVGH
ncbi:hypothetical protein [Xanthomonas vasicola]|uniref:hypothetical protein n=1 Tax=Xanthomonas vasicola TaxID=56459 RepID=UPI00131F0C89|nr:hypothetical protein [Xanthomonas vasicola]MBV6742697.1 hypothetical protein [Xanthomonas vasicola pv. musacearum NCPPB 2251]MBV7278133.1 hypothetical protein [Xanthomonas vasicola pv. musacearum]MBV7290275.1 hypothetical protein [Xanthomonas vasicola pv. musacearum]